MKFSSMPFRRVSLLGMAVFAASAAGVLSQPAGSSEASATQSTIPIGVVASLTGPLASSADQAAVVAPAWAQYVNASGGIDGRHVKIYMEDDQSADPVATQAAATNLINSDHVVAVVAASDPSLAIYQKQLTAAGIPYLSGDPTTDSWYGVQGSFPTLTDTQSFNIAPLYIAKKEGASGKIAEVYCSEVAVCKDSYNDIKAEAPGFGIKTVTGLAVSASAPNYTAQCLALKQQGIKYVNFNVVPSVVASFVEDCQQQGYNPVYGAGYQGIDSSVVAVPGLTLYGTATSFPYSANTKPVAEFRHVMGKYATSHNWTGGDGPGTWSGLELLQYALKNVSGTPTPAKVTSALKAVHGQNLGGLLANKVSYSKPVQLGGMPCFFIYKIANKQLTAPYGLKPFCLSK